jgi:hypothetical protein
VYSENADGNGYATTGIYSLVSGVTAYGESADYALFDSLTGDKIATGKAKNGVVGKSTGLSVVNTQLNLTTKENDWVTNRTYTAEVSYCEEERFAFDFTADYVAPTIEKLRLHYYDYKEDGLSKKRAYLEITLHDNHFAQSVMLCYANGNGLELATDAPSRADQENRNENTTVCIDVTDIYGRQEDMYLYVDDYALNGAVYHFTWSALTEYMQPKWGFWLVEEDTEMTLAINEERAVRFVASGVFHRTHFVWEGYDKNVVAVRDGVIVGVGKGTTEVLVKVNHSDSYTQKLTVTVTEDEVALPKPQYSESSRACRPPMKQIPQRHRRYTRSR